MMERIAELAVHLLLACIAITWLVSLLRADKDPKYPNFSFRAMITNRAGYPDLPKIQEFGSWIAFTLVLGVLTARNLLTEWFVTAYVVTFVARGAFSALLKSKAPPVPEGTTTVSSVQTTTVEATKP